MLFLFFLASLSPLAFSRPMYIFVGPVTHYSCRLGLMGVFAIYSVNSLWSSSLGSSVCWASTNGPQHLSKVYMHDQLQRPKAHKMHAWSVRSSHFKQIPKDHNHGSSLPSASPSHCIIIKVQAYQVLSILNGPRRSKRPNLPHSTFGYNIIVKLKVCLFIPCFYVFFF